MLTKFIYRQCLPIFLISVLICSAALASTKKIDWQIKENCDLPSDNLESKKLASIEECQKSCTSMNSCRAFVYVSGWQRCFLKADFSKQAKIRFISADLPKPLTGDFDAAILKSDHDHTGKDLQRLVLDQAVECGQACQKNEDCHAFTYIEGYRVCWLKAAGGRLSGKVFSCGLPKEGA